MLTAASQPTCSSYLSCSRNNKQEDLADPLNPVKTHARSTIMPKSPFLNTVLCLFLLIILLPCILPKSLKYKRSRPDTLCNVGDEHECVCNKSMGDLDKKYMPCDYFLDVRKLTVLCIKMRHINLNARLYTNESYQQYFRRRIANIISKYCEDKSNGCYTVPSEEQMENNNSTIRPKSSPLDDEKEPEFTPEMSYY
uniref:Uncharacterized protein n=1 Tax=Ditylenchus dipsaci TaxID=166011 RepID=A0A915D200_9BILA